MYTPSEEEKQQLIKAIATRWYMLDKFKAQPASESESPKDLKTESTPSDEEYRKQLIDGIATRWYIIDRISPGPDSDTRAGFKLGREWYHEQAVLLGFACGQTRPKDSGEYMLAL